MSEVSTYHGYDYYYSSDCSVFWYVIYIISDCGFLFDGASYNIGSPCMVLLLPLTPRCAGGVLGLVSMPQQQSPSTLPLQAYASYALGFSTGRFLFQS